MKKLSIIRIIATALIICSLTLPLSRCERKAIVLDGDKITSIKNIEPVQYKYTYAKDWFDLTDWLGWIALFSFLWPMLMLLAGWRSRKIRESKVKHWIEILMSIGSGYFIWALSFGERLFGAYVALSGMALYFVAATSDALRSVTRDKRKNQTEPSAALDAQKPARP
jgi:hypothetical protein